MGLTVKFAEGIVQIVHHLSGDKGSFKNIDKRHLHHAALY